MKKLDKRPSRHQYFMSIALLTADRSTCPRAHVGCVLVDKETHRVRSIGYNGAPSGVGHCEDESCLMSRGHCIKTIHAEINALASTKGEKGSMVAYITHAPCVSCFKALVAFDVEDIYYLYDYENFERDLLVKEYDVSLIKMDL